MSALPVRLAMAEGQALDDYLEQLAQANGLSQATIARLLRNQSVQGCSQQSWMFTAPEAMMRAVTDLSEQRPAATHAGTTAAFRPTDTQVPAPVSWAARKNKGWARAVGTALCPACLAEHGVWRAAWRLRTTVVCTMHEQYVVETCPGCERTLRDHPATTLRRSTGTRCLNPQGVGHYCDYDLTRLVTDRAPATEVERQRRHDAAIAGEKVTVLGHESNPSAYLEDVRNLTVLLLHLAEQPGAELIAPWVPAARQEAATRTRIRGPRWGMSPPTDVRLRSAALTTADEVLNRSDLDKGSLDLTKWIELAPSGAESRLGWLADRTHMTATLSSLVIGALAPHRRVSHYLDTCHLSLEAERIPQAIPRDLYDRYAAHLFATRDYQPRAFLSLCLARSATGAGTWADAAREIGIEPEMGTRITRAVSARSRIAPAALGPVLDRLRRELRPNYRVREAKVHELATWTAWFDDWVAEERPGTRATAFPHAVTWLWTAWAHALASTTPASLAPSTRSQRAASVRFAESLSEAAKRALRARAAPPERLDAA